MLGFFSLASKEEATKPMVKTETDNIKIEGRSMISLIKGCCLNMGFTGGFESYTYT
jgi:hypothetical protein